MKDVDRIVDIAQEEGLVGHIPGWLLEVLERWLGRTPGPGGGQNPDIICLVALSDQEPVGWVLSRRRSRRSGLDVRLLGVREEYRGRGVERRLLGALEEKARALGVSYVVIESGGQEEVPREAVCWHGLTLGVYLELGYRVSQVTMDAHGFGSHDVLLRKWLVD
jgi:GNAT superfamily N-acetyltransferase